MNLVKNYVKEIKASLHSRIRGIKPKHVTSGGVHLRSLAPGQWAAQLQTSKKYCSGGESLPSLCQIWPDRGTNPKPPAPIAMSLQLS